MTNESKLIVGYIRVSTRKQGNSGLSLEDQVRQINNVAELKGCKVVEMIKEVDSGAKKEREGLLKAIELTKKHNATLVVTTLSRLARNHGLILSLLEERKKKNAKFDFQVIDNWGANDFIIQIMSAVATQEYEQICDRNHLALQTRKRRNLEAGRPEMYGIGTDIFKGANNEHGKKGRELGVQTNQKKAKERWNGTVEIIKLLLPTHRKNYKAIATELKQRHNIVDKNGNRLPSATILRLIKRYLTHEPLSVNTDKLQLVPRGYTVKEYIEQHTRQYATELRARGYSYGLISKHFNGNKATTDKGGRFYSTTIKRLIESTSTKAEQSTSTKKAKAV